MPNKNPFELFPDINLKLIDLEQYIMNLLELNKEDIISEANVFLHARRFIHGALFYISAKFGDPNSVDENILRAAAASMQMFHIRNQLMRKHQAGPDSIKLNFIVEYFSDLIDVELRKASDNDEDLQGKIDAIQEITTEQLAADEEAIQPKLEITDYIKRIDSSTAIMFEFACRYGGQSTHADPIVIDSLGEIGRTIGLGYQIKSEIFDLIGINNEVDEFGPLFKLQAGEFTLPTIFAAGKGGVDFINKIPTAGRLEDKELAKLAEFILENGVGPASVMVNEYKDQALFDIDLLPNINAKDQLKKLTNMLLV